MSAQSHNRGAGRDSHYSQQWIYERNNEETIGGYVFYLVDADAIYGESFPGNNRWRHGKLRRFSVFYGKMHKLVRAL